MGRGGWPVAAAGGGRVQAMAIWWRWSLSRLWVAAIRRHSVRTAALPRRWNRSKLRERFEAFGRRDLYDIHLAALFLDAVFLAVRPAGPKEGVLVAWGFTEEGERLLLAVMLGMRESHEDWLALGRDLIARGLGAPMLIVADGAPGLIKAVEQCYDS
jgi:transposase-like protein